MSQSQPQINIKYAIVCDDVRREDNGKNLLIGVYTGSILVPKFPAQSNLAFWMHIEQKSVGKIPVKFRIILDPDEVEVFLADATFEVTKPEHFTTLSLGGISVQFQSPGTLTLQAKQYEGEWESVVSVDVNQMPAVNASNPAAVLPPS